MSVLNSSFLKKVWERLRNSPVPVVDADKYKNRSVIADRLQRAIEDHTFLPTTIHGYIGIQKGGGVTRFLPILTAEDMGVYYFLCYRLAPKILKKKKGVFGAWHMKPKTNEDDEEAAEAFGQGYGVDPFSSKWWLKEWQRFNDLLEDVLADKSVGNYVAATDIANFYDSIEVPRLISAIRKAAPAELDTIEALNAFLSSWNRKHVGYMASTKGIPQEIISDASRVLSHFYLQGFDDLFSDYCGKHGLTYVRWADDMLVFGGSSQKLQSAIHYSSRLLRDLGLNLNASKTVYRSKFALRSHRCLDFLAAINAANVKEVEKQLKIVRKQMVVGANIRLDTIFRAMIGYLHNNTIARTPTNISFLIEVADNNLDLLHSLNNTQMFRFISLMPDPMKSFDDLRKQICKADFGAPKAAYLHMLRRNRGSLAKLGMTHKKAIAAINQIEDSSGDSDVLLSHCIPAARTAYK